MASFSDTLTRFRIIDLETTGTGPDDHVVEIAAVDFIGSDIQIVSPVWVRPPISIPPQASAVHHITDEDVSGSPLWRSFCPSTWTKTEPQLSVCSRRIIGRSKASG